MNEQANWQPDGVPLRLAPEARSANSSLPPFLAPSEDAPDSHGFPLLERSRTKDGWCFGTKSEPDCPGGQGQIQ